MVPVTAVLRGEVGHDDEVAEAGRDVLVAPGTQVGLARLVRLDPLHVDRAVSLRPHHPNSAQARRTTQTRTAAATIT